MLYWGDLRASEVDYILRLPFALRSSYDVQLVPCAGRRIILHCCRLVSVALCLEIGIPPACVGLERFWDKTPWFGYALCALVAPCV